MKRKRLFVEPNIFPQLPRGDPRNVGIMPAIDLAVRLVPLRIVKPPPRFTMWT